MSGKVHLMSKIVISKNVIWREVEEEAVILRVDNSNYYTLNKVGTAIWKLCKPGYAINDIVQKIRREYDVEEAQLLRDIEKFVEELSAEGLIRTE